MRESQIDEVRSLPLFEGMAEEQFGDLVKAAYLQRFPAQVALIGVGPAAYAAWSALLMISILFHHANLRLPERLETVLSWIVMTPRLHGIHHSNVPVERDTNWSSGLAIWDVLHGTRRTDVPQERIVIGVEDVTRPAGFREIVAMPFRT